MIYFTIDLFIDALILMLHSSTTDARTVVEKILSIYEEESNEAAFMENELFAVYVKLIREVMGLNLRPENEQEIESFLLKLKSSPEIMKDPEFYTTLKKIFTDKTDFTQERYRYLIKKLNQAILFHANSKAVKRMFGKLVNNGPAVSPEKQEEAIKKIKDICVEVIKNIDEQEHRFEAQDETTAKTVDFTDKASIFKALKVHRNTTVTNRFLTGLQGLNKALNGGFYLGSSIVFNSLSGQGKTLMLLKMARWQITLNRASAEFKNPTCLFYSLENETPQNTMQLFREMYVNLYKEVPPKDMSDEMIVELCYDNFNKMGWRLVVDRKLGAELGFSEFVTSFMSYVNSGYTPLMCCIDYMNMLRKGAGLDEGVGNHLLLRENYTNVCNFLKSRNCTFVTAHQLNRKAAEVVRVNQIGAVKKFGIDMLADGMDPQREIDIAFYQHKEVDTTGRAFMTWKEDKNRYDPNIPERHKYFAYQFLGDMGILDDVGGPDMSTDNIYKVPYDNEGEGAAETDVPASDIGGAPPLNIFGTTQSEGGK